MSLLKTISQSTGLSEKYLTKVIQKAPYSYKKYTIPKKSGGTRTIFHPSAELKVIQRWLSENYFVKLPVHSSVYSYIRNRNILQNASIHKNNNFLLRLDFHDFFPSITFDDVRRLCESHREDIFPFILSDDEIKIISYIVCKFDPELERSCLTIGAPSSPAISNAILFHHDCVINEYCQSINVSYSRYADDLFFSTNTSNILKDITKFVESTINKIGKPKLSINQDKSVFTSKKRLRKITGLVITSENNTSVGRAYKRQIKTEVFLFLNGNLEQDQINQLKGKLAYCKSVDPQFIQSLVSKYGLEQISKLI